PKNHRVARSLQKSHFIGLWPPRVLLQSRRIPGSCELPKLLHRHHRSHRITHRLAPILNQFLRPEEQHVASSEYDVIPPLRRRNKTVKDPAGSLRPVEANLKAERFS